MAKINIPLELTDTLALDLLDQTLPEHITKGEITRFDFMGKEAVQQRKDFKEAFIYKAVAALGYENLEDITNSAYCYERAAKSALEIKLPLASIECMNRGLSYYISLIRQSENEDEVNKYKKEIAIFMLPRMALAINLVKYQKRERIEQQPPHIWFEEIKTAPYSNIDNSSSLSANP